MILVLSRHNIKRTVKIRIINGITVFFHQTVKCFVILDNPRKVFFEFLQICFFFFCRIVLINLLFFIFTIQQIGKCGHEDI